MNIEDLKMYLVRNSSGQYYRRVGRDGYKSCWTDKVDKASVWTKKGTARSRVTWFATHYPTFPVPDLIEIAAGVITIANEAERIEKVKEAKIRAEARYQERQKSRELKWAQERYEKAQQELIRAKVMVSSLKGDVA